jgi:capsular polysaccharide biosynthesis protein
MLVLALFAGFFVALCLPFALEFLDLRIKTVSDLKDLVDCPVVAVVDMETK